VPELWLGVQASACAQHKSPRTGRSAERRGSPQTAPAMEQAGGDGVRCGAWRELGEHGKPWLPCLFHSLPREGVCCQCWSPNPVLFFT